MFSDEFSNEVRSICHERRGVEISEDEIDNTRVMIKYKLPLNEIIVDFYNELKAVTSGYASFDYEDSGYEKARLIKVSYFWFLAQDISIILKVNDIFLNLYKIEMIH